MQGAASWRARRLNLRLCLLALVAGLLVGPLPAAAERPHGSVLAWGCDFSDFGQCSVPAAAGSGVAAIAAGDFHSVALTKAGSVVAWGCGSGRDLGQCSVPAAAQSGVTAIAAGGYHTLALKSDGSLVAWGCGVLNWGQCSVPPDAGHGVAAIAAGFSDSLALTKEGRVVAWGCGGDNTGQCIVPATAQSGVTAIAGGLYHSLALRSDGSVVAWGCPGGTSTVPPQPSDYGQCAVPAAAQSGVTAIAAGFYQSLALKSDGSVVAWGCGSSGGFNQDFGQCSVPAEAGSGVKAIAAGIYHSLALKDGRVLAWGCRGGAGVCTLPPTATSGVTAISANGHSLALSDPLEQTITVTVHAPATAIDTQSFTVAASSSSGLPVAYSSSGACSSAGATFTMTSSTGTCQVKYDQPGGGAYDTAPQVVESVEARPQPCMVPKVVGKQLRSAKQAIARSHCRTGKVRSAYSAKRKKGIVIAQSRRPGNVLPASSKIDLVVSRGRRR